MLPLTPKQAPTWKYLAFTAKRWEATHNHLVHRLKIKTGHTVVAKTWGQNTQQLLTECCSCISEINHGYYRLVNESIISMDKPCILLQLLHMINWNFKYVNYITCDSYLVLLPLVVHSTSRALVQPTVNTWLACHTLLCYGHSQCPFI